MADENTLGTVKRTYKDSLFRRIFGEREKLLSLYNALNGTAYENAEELQINTLDNAVYLNMKNDISFIFDFQLNLYEHQSTYCANMPLRNLFYIARLLQKEIGKKSLYSSQIIKLPTPVFVVFYNGMDDKPERWTETLSTAYEKEQVNPKLELEVLVLNVNYGNNQLLMKQCRALKEYAIYVAKVRMYAAIMPIADAVDRAVSECICENILADFLSRYRAEVIEMSILEYDEERELKLIREAEYNIGVEKGRIEGRVEGRAEGKAEGYASIIKIIRNKTMSGTNAETIAEDLEMNIDDVIKVVSLIDSYPEADNVEIARRC